MAITILNESELRQCATLDEEALQAVAEGFSRLAAGEATVPPILRVDVPAHQGEVDVKTAYVHGLESFAIKIASGFFGNRALGLPTGGGLMVLVSARTGFPEALLLDNGYLTDVRTGLAGALAARYLARQDVQTAGVIGSGMQARYQMRALRLVRGYERLLVYGITPGEVTAYADEMAAELGIEVQAVGGAEELVRASDLVVTTTPSHVPIVRAEWLHPGLHITAMGADAEHKQELDPVIFAQADVVACDLKSQCFRLGELHHALEARTIDEDDAIVELGELTAGMKVGRRHEDDITICDLTGVGVQDTAIALLAYRRAVDLGLGMTVG